MSTPYIGEIRLFAGNFAPQGWSLCDGSLMPISGNEALFVLIGTTYGGDGQNTFALPDLRGRMPCHVGAGYVLGQNGGAENATLTATQIPSHTHPIPASSGAATTRSPASTVPALADRQVYSTFSPDIAGSVGVVSTVGGNQSHTNLSPYLTVNFIIALEGIFPSQS